MPAFPAVRIWPHLELHMCGSLANVKLIGGQSCQEMVSDSCAVLDGEMMRTSHQLRVERLRFSATQKVWCLRYEFIADSLKETFMVFESQVW